MKINKNTLYLMIFCICATLLFYYTYQGLNNLFSNKTELSQVKKENQNNDTLTNQVNVDNTIDREYNSDKIEVSEVTETETKRIIILEKKMNEQDEILKKLDIDNISSVEEKIKFIIYNIIPLNSEALKNKKIKDKYLSLLNFALSEIPNTLSEKNQNLFCNSKNYIISEIENLNAKIDNSSIEKINKICLK
jgi:hypothetical protein